MTTGIIDDVNTTQAEGKQYNDAAGSGDVDPGSVCSRYVYDDSVYQETIVTQVFWKLLSLRYFGNYCHSGILETIVTQVFWKLLSLRDFGNYCHSGILETIVTEVFWKLLSLRYFGNYCH